MNNNGETAMERKRKGRKKSTRITATISFSMPEEFLPLIDERLRQLQVLPNRSQYLCELVLRDLQETT
jgi:hypothetical protein